MDGYEDHIRCWTPQTLYELNLGVVVGDIKPETDWRISGERQAEEMEGRGMIT